MKQEKITLERIYEEIKNLQQEMHIIKNNIEKQEPSDWSDMKILADDKLLAEIWLTPEEDEAWKDL